MTSYKTVELKTGGNFIYGGKANENPTLMTDIVIKSVFSEVLEWLFKDLESSFPTLELRLEDREIRGTSVDRSPIGSIGATSPNFGDVADHIHKILCENGYEPYGVNETKLNTKFYGGQYSHDSSEKWHYYRKKFD